MNTQAQSTNLAHRAKTTPPRGARDPRRAHLQRPARAGLEGVRDGMLGSGMEEGLDQSYAALDRLLETLA